MDTIFVVQEVAPGDGPSAAVGGERWHAHGVLQSYRDAITLVRLERWHSDHHIGIEVKLGNDDRLRPVAAFHGDIVEITDSAQIHELGVGRHVVKVAGTSELGFIPLGDHHAVCTGRPCHLC